MGTPLPRKKKPIILRSQRGRISFERLRWMRTREITRIFLRELAKERIELNEAQQAKLRKLIFDKLNPMVTIEINKEKPRGRKDFAVIAANRMYKTIHWNLKNEILKKK